MSRLIDADATKRRVADTFFDTLIPCVNRALDDSPTIDAVPVVRCKDCKHYKTGVCLKIYYDGLASRYAWQERKPDDFCSYGEKRRDKDGTT